MDNCTSRSMFMVFNQVIMFNIKWLPRPNETRRFQEKRSEQAPAASRWNADPSPAASPAFRPQPWAAPSAGPAMGERLSGVGSSALRSETQALRSKLKVQKRRL